MSWNFQRTDAVCSPSQSTRRQLTVYRLSAYGLPAVTVYPLSAYGLPAVTAYPPSAPVYSLSAYGLLAVCSRSARCLLTVYLPSAYGLPVVCLRSTRCLLTVYPLSAYGLPAVCSWSACLQCVSSTHELVRLPFKILPSFAGGPDWASLPGHVVVEVLLYVHRNRRFIRDGSPGRPPRHSHNS